MKDRQRPSRGATLRPRKGRPFDSCDLPPARPAPWYDPRGRRASAVRRFHRPTVVHLRPRRRERVPTVVVVCVAIAILLTIVRLVAGVLDIMS